MNKGFVRKAVLGLIVGLIEGTTTSAARAQMEAASAVECEGSGCDSSGSTRGSAGGAAPGADASSSSGGGSGASTARGPRTMRVRRVTPPWETTPTSQCVTPEERFARGLPLGMGYELAQRVSNECPYRVQCRQTFPGSPTTTRTTEFWLRSGERSSSAVGGDSFAMYDNPPPSNPILLECRPDADCDSVDLVDVRGACFQRCPRGYERSIDDPTLCRTPEEPELRYGDAGGGQGNPSASTTAPGDGTDGGTSTREETEQTRLETQRRDFERRRDAALEAQEARDVARRNQQDAQSASNASFLLMVFGTARSGENSRYRGTSWHFRLSAGLGFMWVPVAEESSTSTDSAGSSTSSTSSNVGAGGGIGMNLGLEIWPVYNHYLSIGGFAEGAVAYLSGTGSSQFGYSGIVGARALLGVDWVSLIGEIGTGVRGASTSSDSTFGYSAVYISTSSSGSEDYSLSRLGAGVRFCFSRSEAAWRERTVARACQSGLDLMAFLEQPSIVGVADPVNLWRVSFWGSNFGAITGEFGNYPVSPDSDGYSGRDGFYLTISLVKPFDWFGEPYVEPTANPGVDDATSPPTLDSAGSGTVGGGSPTIALGPSNVQVSGRCMRGEISGRWFNGANFEMELRQQGAIVTGHYRVGSAGVEGDLHGNLTPDGSVLTGTWAETNGRSGRFEWTFDERAARFTGQFGNNADPLTLQWVASRDCSGR